MKTDRKLAAKLSVNLFGVHPSGCRLRSNTLKRGHRTTAHLASLAALATSSLLLLGPAFAHAQGGVPLWTNRYPKAGASAIAVDGSGNVFVTGISYWNGSNADYVTIKYSNTGVPLWTNRHNGPGNGDDVANAIAVDNGGNAFVTGRPWNGSKSDYATIKYSNTGVPLWTNRYNGGADPRFGDSADAIAVDSGGDVLVTGQSFGGIGNGYDYATIKYSKLGIPLWTNRYNGPASKEDSPSAIAVDATGNMFVTGRSEDHNLVGDYATVAYSSAGDLLWANRYDGLVNGSDQARAIALDSDGNVFVTGHSATFPSSPWYYDFATIKYSNAGVPLWANFYNGPADQSDNAKAIAVDGIGNVFVTGYKSSPATIETVAYSGTGDLLWENHTPGLVSSIAVDSSGNVFITGDASGGYLTIGYSNAGVPLWTNRYNGPEEDIATAIAVDRSGNVFVTGFSYNGTNEDIVTIKYSSSIPSPPRLEFQTLNNELVLSWTNAGFNLQSAPFVTGPFTNLPAATSPYTNPLTAPQQFFRLISN
jgi:hypothetical protein